MRRDRPIEEFEEFLQRSLVSTLATLHPNGSVLLSPVWHRWREGGFEVTTGAGDIKVRHLRRNARATLVVAEQEPPYRGIEVRGEAVLSDNPNWIRDAARDIFLRYEGYARDEPSEFAEGLVIRLEPGALRTWDFADEY